MATNSRITSNSSERNPGATDMADLLAPFRILIVEECEDDYDLLVLKLRQAGFEPSAFRVETVAEIQEALSRSEWDMVFSDFDLPGFNGLLALDLVRARNPDIPFFIVSGVIDEEQAVAAMKAGARDYFFKGKLARLGPAVSREMREANQRRRRREAQVELDRGRDLLRHDGIRSVDVMSHELRTPLNIINVAAGMLVRYNEQMDSSGRRERISEIQAAVGRMTRVIDRALLTSRLEMQRWNLRSEAFDLAAWCREFLAQNPENARDRRRIRLQLVDVPPKVAMDQRVVEIALENLLSNGLKYSPPDSPVDLEVRGDGSGRIQFTVRDQGIGIPEKDVPHVWDSFYRGSNATDAPGAGLGLAIVKGCTEVHGGTIEVESRLGEGTCVKMRLPDGLQLPDGEKELAVSRAEVIQP
jgi:signal transduction histidine kinase